MKDSKVLPLSPQGGTHELVEKIQRDASNEAPRVAARIPSRTAICRQYERNKKMRLEGSYQHTLSK